MQIIWLPPKTYPLYITPRHAFPNDIKWNHSACHASRIYMFFQTSQCPGYKYRRLVLTGLWFSNLCNLVGDMARNTHWRKIPPRWKKPFVTNSRPLPQTFWHSDPTCKHNDHMLCHVHNNRSYDYNNNSFQHALTSTERSLKGLHASLTLISSAWQICGLRLKNNTRITRTTDIERAWDERKFGFNCLACSTFV